MKHKLIAILLSAALLGSCSLNDTAAPDSSDSSLALPPATAQPNLPAGVRFLSEDSYDFCAPFVNGFAFAEMGDQWGYLDRNGVFTPTVSTVGEGIDCNGIRVGLDYLREVNENPFPASTEGCVPFYEGGKWGLRNLITGVVIKEAVLSYPAIMTEGRAVITEGDKVSVIKADGSVAFTVAKAAQPYFANERLIVKLPDDKDGTLSVVDPDGKQKFTIGEYGTGGEANIYGTTPFASDNLKLIGTGSGQPIYWGRFDGGSFEFVDVDGKMPFKTSDNIYTASTYHCNRAFMQNKNNLSALFDQNGKQLTDYIFSGYLNFVTPEHTLVQQGAEELVLIDNTGKQLGTEIFDTLIALPQPGYIIVGRGEKVGVVNALGELVVPFTYDDILPAANGMSWVKSGELYSLLDAGGKAVGFSDAAEVGWLGESFYLVNIAGRLRVMTVGP